MIERAAWLVEDLHIDAAFLSRISSGNENANRLHMGIVSTIPVLRVDPVGSLLPLRDAREDFERTHVSRALEAAGGSVTAAAAILGMLPNNLSRKLKELGISRAAWPGR